MSCGGENGGEIQKNEEKAILEFLASFLCNVQICKKICVV